MVARIENYALLCWILKDASWVLLFPYTAWLALAGALSFETWYVVSSFQEVDVFQRLHRLVCHAKPALEWQRPLIWISGNGIWMTAELMYEKPNPNIHFPWFPQPVMGKMDGPDDAMRVVAGVLFAGAFLCWCTAQIMGRVRSAPARTINELDQDAWIGFWALKDLCWLYAAPWPALLCSVAVLSLLIRAVGLRENSKGSLFLAETTWLSANTLWLISELMLGDVHPVLRVSAFLILMLALWFNMRAMSQMSDKEMIGETSAILSAKK